MLLLRSELSIGFGKTIEHATKRLLRARKVRAGAGLFVERKNVVAGHHSGSQRERAFVGLETFGVEAQIIKPPRVSLVEPLQQRGILELIARNVSIVEQRVEIFFVELFVLFSTSANAFVYDQIIGSFAATRTFQFFN